MRIVRGKLIAGFNWLEDSDVVSPNNEARSTRHIIGQPWPWYNEKEYLVYCDGDILLVEMEEGEEEQ